MIVEHPAAKRVAPETTPSGHVLSAELRARILTEVGNFPQPRSALLGALHMAQAEHSYLSRAVIDEVAVLLGLLPIQVQEVVSFYPMFHDRPVGKCHIQICTNIACALAGARKLVRRQQFAVRAALDDAPLVHHQDLVGVHHGGQAVRDDQRGAALAMRSSSAWIAFSDFESSAEVASSKIRMRGFFRMARAIATRCFSPPESFRPALAHHGVVLRGQAHDEIVDVRGARRRDHFVAPPPGRRRRCCSRWCR